MFRLSSLDRKLVRDLIHLRGQVLAISLVVACGVAAFVTTRTSYEALLTTMTSYYEDYRFADVFVQLKRAPEPLADRIRATPGVDTVETRIVRDVTLDVAGLEEPATGRIVSLPEGTQPNFNALYIRRGRYPEPGRREEVIASEAFATAHGLDIGDKLGAVLNGRWQQLRIVGIALSPEYIYEIRGTDIFPDNKRFGILWMGRNALEAAFDMEGAFNDVSLSLSSGSNEKQVISEIDGLLERYGGLGAYGRTEQVSNRFISDEIAQNRVSGIVVPSIFLGVAAFLINIVLSRLVQTQREQIAVLKAFGYRDLDLTLHYTKLAVGASVAGMAAGTVVGVWWGGKIGEIYGQFYRFPLIRFEPRPDIVGFAILISGGAAVFGAIGAARKAVRLPAAEAMRPEAPPSFRGGVVERIGLAHLLSPAARIIARNLERGWVRAGSSILGIALAVAILVVGHYFEDAIRLMADSQFRHAQRDDVTIVFNDPQPGRARYELAHLPGVLLSEPFRTVPARMRSGHRTRRVGLIGIDSGGQLRRLVDKDLRVARIPDDGVVLTARLGEILGVNAGDEITAEILEGVRPVRKVIVAGLVDELIGIAGYLDIRALNRLMREDNTISGSFLRIDSSVSSQLYSVLKSVPAIGGVSFRKAALASFEETLARSIGIFSAVLIAFAGAIAFAMVYNAARISLSERGRELASLRVLGFTRPEVASMLLGEQIILILLAIPSGFAIGYWICHLITLAYQWELFRLPLVVGGETYAFAAMVIAISAILSAVVVRRRIDRLDLVAVLKTRE